MKRTIKLLLIFAAFVLTALLFGATAFAASPADGLTATVDGQMIRATDVGGQAYLFLPSNADLGAVQLDDGNGAAPVNVAALPFADGAYAYGDVKIMRSANVGAMFVTTADPAYGRAWVDGSPDHSNDAGKKTELSMVLVSADGEVIYDGALTSLKGRGNTTWATSAKKPYQIKLDKKTDLLNTGDKANKNKTWILLANALDKTLFKNALSFDLARYLGLGETPEYTFVDLYYDGEYRGLYQLTEKAQINDGRVEIDELESHNTVTDESATATGTNSLGLAYQYNPTAVCDAEDISGGYLLEQDNAFYGAENSWFVLYNGSHVVVKSPEFCTKEQIEYVSVLFNRAAYAAEHDTSDGISVTELFDLDSLAALYMVNEYTKNWDFTASSTYFFLPETGSEKYAHKFYAGPAWDFDTSLGSRTELPAMREPTGLFRHTSSMFKGSLVRSAIREKAASLERLGQMLFAAAPDALDGVRSLSAYRAALDSAQRMNFTIWPFDNTVNTFAKPTYEENYAYVYDFLQKRHGDILPAIAAWKTPDYARVEACMRGEHTPEQAATCTAAGRTGAACAVCGQRFAQSVELPALGHLDANGDRICERCGKYAGSVPAFIEPLMRLIAMILRVFRAMRPAG